MIDLNLCSTLPDEYSGSCAPITRKHDQVFIFINKADIDSFTIKTPQDSPGTCDFTVSFTLKCDKKGFVISGLPTGNTFKAWASKSRDDNGYPVYNHQAEMFIHGAEKEEKCLLDALDRGSYIVVTRTTNGVIEVYGWYHGIQTGDYDYDIVEGGGGAIIPLSSNENALEPYHPFIYDSTGDAQADFDSAFAGPEC